MIKEQMKALQKFTKGPGQKNVVNIQNLQNLQNIQKLQNLEEFGMNEEDAMFEFG